MKSAIFAAVVALAVPAVYAQVPGLPDCAGPCLASGLSVSGCDNPSDFKCVCSSIPFVTAAGHCFHSSCDSAQVGSAISAARAFCQSVGVTIPIPIMTTRQETLPEVTTRPAITTTGPETTTTTEVTTVVPTTEITIVLPTTEDTIVLPTTEVTTVAPTTEVPYPTTSCPSTTLVTYSGTTLTTTTIYGTGSMTQTRNITSPTVVPPPSNSESAGVKNIVSLSALVMAVVGFFAL
ncbi:hypothetical protein BGX38DRAFT_1276641 [Terfezia claveryi]|nr:hypothetical protein BGX38DRAFT_1276641 [Terfezia claveryi]